MMEFTGVPTDRLPFTTLHHQQAALVTTGHTCESEACPDASLPLTPGAWSTVN